MWKFKEDPIFSKQRINFTPTYALTHLCVANKRIVLAMQNKVLLKIDLTNPDSPEEIDLKALGIEARIWNMYLDPSGQHLILSFRPHDSQRPAQVMYSGPKVSLPKEIQKLSGHIITAMAWNPTLEGTTSDSTTPFLLGTSKGLLFEGDVANGEVNVSKQLYDIGKGSAAVISGLDYFFIPRSLKCFILVATARKLYQFQGFVSSKDDRSWFNYIFNSYLSQSGSEEVLEFGERSPSHVSDKAVSDRAISRLNILYDIGTGYPKRYGYVVDGSSMVFKDIQLASSSSMLDNFLKDVQMIPYPKSETIPSSPLCALITDYHAILLYKDSVKTVCTLNQEVVFEDNFERGQIINITRDPIEGSIWFFTERGVHKFVVRHEDRNVWKIYLDKEDFAKAEESARGSEEKMQEISTRQAEYFFKQKEYEKSAMYYSLTKSSFEEIALKFSEIDDSSALKTFLTKKLSTLPQAEATQVATIVLWIVELYLNELGTMRDFGKGDSAEYRNTETEFLQFMGQKTVKDCVRTNKKAVYDLMASHGDKENLVTFTLLMRDFDEVIENNIANGQYHSALKTLQRQKDKTLYPKFIPTLLDKDPSATIDVLIEVGPMLNPVTLLPKFSSKLDNFTAAEITRYLEYCTNNLRMTDQQLHDYLVSLYVHYAPEQKLMSYLELQGNDSHHVRYSPTYALNMCLEKKLHPATIHLYTIMGLYEEAVALAIDVDLDLAKKTANVPEDDEELRKKLWLRIAQHVVKEKNNIQQAMEFLRQCDLLKIEDILPFFPNFVTIDHFRDAICSQLQDYNRHIHDLKFEMEEATKAAEVMREEIQQVRNRCSVIKSTDLCTLCETPLLTKSFYVFSCGHLFHGSCVIDKVVPLLSNPRKQLLAEHQRRLQETTMRQDALSTDSAGINTRDQIISEMTDIVASECVFCGEQMIKLIDVPFISDQDYNRIQKDWE